MIKSDRVCDLCATPIKPGRRYVSVFIEGGMTTRVGVEGVPPVARKVRRRRLRRRHPGLMLQCGLDVCRQCAKNPTAGAGGEKLKKAIASCIGGVK